MNVRVPQVAVTIAVLALAAVAIVGFGAPSGAASAPPNDPALDALPAVSYLSTPNRGAGHGRGGAARWVVQDLGTPAGRPSAATALNAPGQVVGGYAGGGIGGDNCFVGFLWQQGGLKLVHPEECVSWGDMWRTNAARAITRGGRVLGEVFCAGCTGGNGTFWLSPPLPDPTNSQQKRGGQYSWQDPNPL